MGCSVDLSKSGAEPTVFPGGIGNTAVLISEVAFELTDCDSVFSYTDNDTTTGCRPYWVRVSQINGGQAWSESDIRRQ